MNTRIYQRWRLFLVISILGVSVYFLTGLLPITSTVPAPLRIAINGWPGYAHAFIAQQKGIFKQYGAMVQLIFYKDMPEAMLAYKNGDVDGAFGVFSDAIIMVADGFPTKVVYIVDYSQSGDVIIGRPELTSLADLKGKVVSFENPNSFSHIFVAKALEGQGLNEINVRFELVPSTNVLWALEEGRIDAGHTWEPVASQALAKGYRILATAGDFPGIITDVLFVHEAISANRAPELQALVQSLLKAREESIRHPEENLAIMAQGAKMSMTEITSGLAGIVQINQQENYLAMTNTDTPYSLKKLGKFIIQFLLERGELPRIPDLESLIEPRFVQTQ